MKPTLVIDDMHYWRIAPDPRLRAQVVCYWMVQSAREDAPSKHTEAESLMIPDGHSEIVFNRGNTGFSRWKLDAADRPTVMRSSYIIGGRSHSVSTRSFRPLRLAGVKLDPRALRTLVGMPLGEFRDDTLNLRDLDRRVLLELEERIALADSAAGVAALLDRHLLAALGNSCRNVDATDALLRQIHVDRGATQILDWAREHRLDVRNLERRFRAATGLTPKQYARVIRFKRTYLNLISAGRRARLSAQVDGFYDQSHFNREFRYFTGVSPGEKLWGRVSRDMNITDHLLEGERARTAAV